jgi:glutamine phosphoribosylpyrophosphate amidotransferase
LKDAIGVGDPGFCTACLTGDYPTSVPIMLSVGAGSAE